jgi:transcriptional regulator with XRE-family HTH domain
LRWREHLPITLFGGAVLSVRSADGTIYLVVQDLCTTLHRIPSSQIRELRGVVPLLEDLRTRLRDVEQQLEQRMSPAQRNTIYRLVQYEHGTVLPPLDRLAALAAAYHTPLSSLVVSHDALAPVVALLERATPQQIRAPAELLEQVLAEEQERQDR